MASILRQIVAGPRLRHPEARLDLCYVSDEIVATSGPSSTYPKRAYRNPTDALVKFLDRNHGQDWSIWEFRAEGTGYPDEEVYGRIHHFPWPDHHPPPFALIPPLMASMRNWLNGGEKRVAVVHCKAGKGRSGTAACSFLISERDWKAEDALRQFTERRMRVGFGPGVSIPSQVRWVGYVDRWKNVYDKIYLERPVEIVEIHIWGLKSGLKVDVEGFVDEGRKIKRYHRFHGDERYPRGDNSSIEEGEEIEDGDKPHLSVPEDLEASLSFQGLTKPEPLLKTISSVVSMSKSPSNADTEDVVLRPRKKIILPTSDVNIDFERRAVAASYSNWTMVTSVGHIWFNAYFEGGHEHDSGVFEAEWEALDGIKGTSSKGTRAIDRLQVVWRYHTPDIEAEQVITEPKPGEDVPEGHATDWRGTNGAECENEEPSTSEDEVNDIGSDLIDSVSPQNEAQLLPSGATTSPSTLNLGGKNLKFPGSGSAFPTAAESLVNATAVDESPNKLSGKHHKKNKRK
ncbi:Telomerase protein component 1 [Myotisia sp. PD_48]|nr:Telomerase protein component 1 [Myotisia sp. PD_48]